MKGINKKLLSIILSVSMLLAAVSIVQAAEDPLFPEHTSGIYKYIEFSDGIGIRGCDTSVSGELVVPSSIDGKPVVYILGKAFNGCDKITSLVIPEGVESIGTAAIEGCGALEEIKLPSSLKRMSFYAVSECHALESLVLPEGLEVLEQSAISSCYNLKTIYIPSTLRELNGDKAFWTCTGLEKIIVSENNLYYSSDEDGVLYNKDKTKLINYPCGKTQEEYTVRSGVETIGMNAFRSSDIGVVIIPETVRTIEEAAFNSCKYLNCVTFYDGIEKIDDYAFARCDRLVAIHIPATVTSIGENVFYMCKYFNEISVADESKSFTVDEDGVLFSKDKTEIIKYTAGSKRESYTVPDGVEKVYGGAFEWAENLGSVTLPDGLTYIGDNAFEHCSKLNSLKLPDSVTEIGNYAFAFCRIMQRINIPDGVAVIEQSTFAGCNKLEEITIPKSVKEICYNAFSGCNTLETVAIPENVVSIGETAFQYCSSLTSVTIPASVEEIGLAAFENCYALADVYFDGIEKELINITDNKDNRNDPLLNAELHCNDESTHVHNFKIFTGYSEEHPHKDIYACKCGEEVLIGEGKKVGNCEECYPPALLELRVVNLPQKLNYTYKSAVSEEGIKVVAKYGNGKTVDVTNDVEIVKFNTDIVGERIAGVIYAGRTATFEYTVEYTWWQQLIRILLLGFLWY